MRRLHDALGRECPFDDCNHLGHGRARDLAEPSRAAFAACLTAHGFTASVGSAATAGNNVLSIEGVIVSGNVDPSSPQFQAAMAACRKYLPGGGPPR